jgi:hypothetical protein
MNCELQTENQSRLELIEGRDFRAPTLDSYFPKGLRQPTPTRLPCGTLKDSLTVATFRSWRSWASLGCAGPDLQHHTPDPLPENKRTSGGNSTPV